MDRTKIVAYEQLKRFKDVTTELGSYDIKYEKGKAEELKVEGTVANAIDDIGDRVTNVETGLSVYLTKTDADKKYVAKSSSQNSAINVDKGGAMANFSDNGQAYLAVRPKGAKFLIPNPFAGASFGVKDDGTAAFSHKTYTTYNKTDGSYTGARNTAVLQFSGPTGLRYAKNIGSGNDVTEEMYKYVGVIDSPDENQRVYSAAQVDELISGLTSQIRTLQEEIDKLKGE